MREVNIKTNSPVAREILTRTKLESDDNKVSLDVMSFYANIPLKEAIHISMRRMCQLQLIYLGRL